MKKRTTAADLLAKLHSDPEWVAKRAQEEEVRQRRVEQLRQAEEPLIRDLRKVGFEVESAWDFVNTAAAYPSAVPILLEHLQKPYPDWVRGGIARALAVPDAKFAWPVLVRFYKCEVDKAAKDGLAVAIAAMADDEELDEVISLLRTQEHGPSRILLLSVLERSKDRRARSVLMELGTDPDLTKEIQVILRRLRRKNGH